MSKINFKKYYFNILKYKKKTFKKWHVRVVYNMSIRVKTQTLSKSVKSNRFYEFNRFRVLTCKN